MQAASAAWWIAGQRSKIRAIKKQRARRWAERWEHPKTMPASKRRKNFRHAQAKTRAADRFDQRRSGATPHVSRHGESFFDAASLMANRSLKLRRV
ncbi:MULTISPECIES: hypothetical protein [Lysobacter]|uniref:hypothetical protein n=1 Tax=Lysobacter TaxID=68 RepID=UPI001F185A4B|nr:MULTISPECIES: hypothetical protein [Lysobacter]UJB18554.1 hypothetical protein L1A79_19810 [Lysobacter capsici]UJQ27721.1 hypothetical protein L2D09_20075 [Lysobacter gummosus]